MLRRPWWSLVLGVALPAYASQAASHRVCFEHVGLQGKPMPAFCLARTARSGDQPSSPARPVLVVSASTFDDVFRRCSTDRFDPASPQAGVYRWTRDGSETASGVVGPQSMRWIADRVRQDAIRRGEAVPEVVLRLRRRLGT